MGNTLLTAATVAASFAVLTTAWSLRVPIPERTTPTSALGSRWRGPHVSQVWGWLFLAFIATAVVHLLLLLANGDFSIRYVWQHSASHESPVRRLGALLAGPEGTLLVWGLFAALAACWTATRWRRSTVVQQRDTAIVHLIVASIALALLLVTVVSTPFKTFVDAYPSVGIEAVPAEGRGLNPVLTNPWMPPHTLLTFAGYALLGLVFAIGVIQLLRTAQGRADDAQRWRQPGLRVARWAWLLLSAALLSGVIWAYEEMTFGWFWSWDPVEAATLLVWLLLTAALHAGGEEDGGRRELVYTPLLSALSFIGVVFASFVTRSGLHPSVHGFAGGSAGRYLGVGLAALGIAVAILAVTSRRKIPPTPSRRPWLFWAVWPLVAGGGLIMWGLVFPIAVTGLLGRNLDLDTGFFTTWGYLLAVGLLLLMGFGMQAAKGRRRDAAMMLAFFVALTALAAVVKPVPALELMKAEGRSSAGAMEVFLGGASVLSLLPPVAYALLAVVERWWLSRRETSRLIRVRHTGSAIVHVGVVAAVLGATFATVLSSFVTVGVSPATGVGVGEGVTVVVTDLRRSEHLDGLGVLVEERETATLEVWSDRGVLAAGTATLSTYPKRDMGRHARVMISRGFIGDIQVIYHGVAELRSDGVPVTIRRIPLVNLLWAGLLLMIGGMAVMSSTRARASGPGNVPAAPTAKSLP